MKKREKTKRFSPTSQPKGQNENRNQKRKRPQNFMKHSKKCEISPLRIQRDQPRDDLSSQSHISKGRIFHKRF